MRGTITMHRRGDFAYKPIGPNHCGVLANTPMIPTRYEVELECLPVLDGRGFLVDQLIVRDFFTAITEVSMSCERLTEWCSRALVDWVHKHRRDCRVVRCRVKLAPEPYEAAIEYEHRIPQSHKHTNQEEV